MMTLLSRLVEAFVYTFGITPPRPEQQRIVNVVLGGLIAITGVAIVAVIVGMFVSTR